MELAELLRECQGDMNQGELAGLLGISQAQLSRLFSGKRRPGRVALAGMLRAFPEKRDRILSVFLPENETEEYPPSPVGSPAK